MCALEYRFPQKLPMSSLSSPSSCSSAASSSAASAAAAAAPSSSSSSNYDTGSPGSLTLSEEYPSTQVTKGRGQVPLKRTCRLSLGRVRSPWQHPVHTQVQNLNVTSGRSAQPASEYGRRVDRQSPDPTHPLRGGADCGGRDFGGVAT
jgi:hypothetical protein